MKDITSSHEFTSKLQIGDIVVSVYGLRFSESIWGGTWYTHFSTQEIDRIKSDNSFELVLTIEHHKVYRRIKSDTWPILV